MIEDLQWIDPTSRELLEAIVQLAADLSLFVLVTSRPGPAEESMIAAFRAKPNVAIHSLGPLSEEHSSAIIVNAFEGIHCPPSVAAAIVKRTEPDRLPFYLEELAHFVRDKLAAQGNSLSADDVPQAIHGEQAMPVNLEMVLREMLDRLSPAAKALAQIASAVGSGFSRSLLQSVCRFPPDDFEQAFGELVEDRFISASGAAQFMQYWFRHELLRDAVYQACCGAHACNSTSISPTLCVHRIRRLRLRGLNSSLITGLRQVMPSGRSNTGLRRANTRQGDPPSRRLLAISIEP